MNNHLIVLFKACSNYTKHWELCITIQQTNMKLFSYFSDVEL